MNAGRAQVVFSSTGSASHCQLPNAVTSTNAPSVLRAMIREEAVLARRAHGKMRGFFLARNDGEHLRLILPELLRDPP